MALRDHFGGWFLAPRRRERRVDDHHLAVLRDPVAYGLTPEDIDRIGPRDRVAILTAVLRSGWVRVRVPPTRDAVIHIEVWTLDRARARRIESWLRHRDPGCPHDAVQLGVVAVPTYEGMSFARLLEILRDR